MLTIQNKKWFTLVELIVVITILAILWTIAFISLQNYSTYSRNSIRINDIQNISKFTEVFKIEKWIYPKPNNSFVVSHSGATIWTQGIVWDDFITNIERITDTPTDPTTNLNYTYSLAAFNTEFEIWAAIENNWLTGLFPQSYAADSDAVAYISWNYNEKYTTARVDNILTTFVLPSITTSREWDQTISNILENGALVTDWGKTLPAWLWNNTNSNDVLSFSTANDMIIFTWATTKSLVIKENRLLFADDLQNKYTTNVKNWSSLSEINKLSNNPDEQILSYLEKGVWWLRLSSELLAKARIVTFTNSICEWSEFKTYPGSETQLTTEMKSKATLAYNWLESMQAPLEKDTILNTWTITPSESAEVYNQSYTGMISGTFTLNNPGNYEVTNDSKIIISFPANEEELKDTWVEATRYRSIVSGNLSSDINPWSWTHHIQAYLEISYLSGWSTVYEKYYQWDIPVNSDGTWSFDASWYNAAWWWDWVFNLFTWSDTGDSRSAATPGWWPAPWYDFTPQKDYYKYLRIASSSITDNEYPNTASPIIYSWPGENHTIHNQKASVDGTFEFESSPAWTKVLRLVDISSLWWEPISPDQWDIMAKWINPKTDLVRSFVIDPNIYPDIYNSGFPSRSYAYDQALALLAAISQWDQANASKLARWLVALQIPQNINFSSTENSYYHNKNGSIDGQPLSPSSYRWHFVFSWPQLWPLYTDFNLRTWAHAIATAALLKYLKAYPNDPNYNSYRAASVDALNWLDTKLGVTPGSQTEGLYTGWAGRYATSTETVGSNTYSSWEFIAEHQIEWAAIEHNVDAWHTLTIASSILSDSSYKTKADNLKAAILWKLWDSNNNRFYQWIGPGGPDTASPLDANSWGAIFLVAIWEYEKAGQALWEVNNFKHTHTAPNWNSVTWYTAYDSALWYPWAVEPNVWFEWTYWVSLAYLRTWLYEEYIESITDSYNWQVTTSWDTYGSFPYVTNTDNTWELQKFPSVASSAWYVLWTVGRDYIFTWCDIPSTEVTEVVFWW